MSLGQFGVTGFEQRSQLLEFALLRLELAPHRKARLSLRLIRHLAALGGEATGYLLFDTITLSLERCFPLPQLPLEALELLLLAPEQRRGQRFGQLDFRLAVRALDDRLGNALAARFGLPRAHSHDGNLTLMHDSFLTKWCQSPRPVDERPCLHRALRDRQAFDHPPVLKRDTGRKPGLRLTR